MNFPLSQEEIINTVSLQTTSDVKKGNKWSTFLMKPDKPVPNPKRKLEEKPKVTVIFYLALRKVQKQLTG